jgi:CRP/FNR family transcriptional regulator, cyclic AMP receptor protein
MTRWDAIGYLASGLVFASFCMRDMIPLRLVSVCSNLAFLTYGLALGLVPVWVLHGLLLPINCWRVWQGVGTRANPEGQAGR